MPSPVSSDLIHLPAAPLAQYGLRVQITKLGAAAAARAAILVQQWALATLPPEGAPQERPACSKKEGGAAPNAHQTQLLVGRDGRVVVAFSIHA